MFTHRFCSLDMDDRDLEVLANVWSHLEESIEYFSEDQVAFIALQGSQNYGLEVPGNNVDAKLVLLPSLDDLIFNRKPVSTTHIRENNEHTDWKDLRLMFQTFRKQNLNFIEILYSPWIVANSLYADRLAPLFQNRDLIARYNPAGAVRTMKGIALERYRAMEHRCPNKIDIIDTYGYDPKQLHHLLRIEDFIRQYINEVPYEACLRPENADFLKSIKTKPMPLDIARDMAHISLNHTIQLADDFRAKNPEMALPAGDELLNDVQSDVIKLGIRRELDNA